MAAYAGGGIYVDSRANNPDWMTVPSAALTLIDSTISSNTSNAGGGIYNEDGTLVVINSTISHNTATSTATDGYGIYNGGGIYNNGPYVSGTKIGAMTLINTTIAGNTAPDASGIYENGTTGLITNCTITGNIATDGNASGFTGAGVGNWDNGLTGNLTLNNTIVAGNFNTSNALGNGNVSADIGGPVVGSYNLVGTGSNLVDGVDGNHVGVTNLGLGSLAYNGGPTQTILPLSGSPVINTGNMSPGGGCRRPPTDHRSAGYGPHHQWRRGHRSHRGGRRHCGAARGPGHYLGQPGRYHLRHGPELHPAGCYR